MSRLLDAKASDLAGIYAEIAEEIGVENTYALYERFHGLQLVFPQRIYSNEFISKKIQMEYESGKLVREIAQEYDYSVGTIHHILRKNKQK